MEKMRQLLEGAGLCMPPVPDQLVVNVVERGNWFYATRDVSPSEMYSPNRRYVEEVVAGAVEDYMAFCHGGHGINSYEIVYNLVYRQLALFTGTGWGGSYMGKKESAAVKQQFRRCAELVSLLQGTQDMLPPPPKRLIVVEEEFSTISICEWLDRPLGSLEEANAWLSSCPRRKEGAVNAAIRVLKQAGKAVRRRPSPS